MHFSVSPFLLFLPFSRNFKILFDRTVYSMRLFQRSSYPGPGKKRGLMLLFLVGVFAGSCSVAEPKTAVNANTAVAGNSASTANASAPSGATIDITPNGPADTVRAFYKLLREKKFREAIFLTNLRPAIEGLTDTELKEFSVDFEAIAGQIPAEIEINGEIITADQATVTANLPTEDGDKNEIQSIRLRKEGDVWVIQTVDDEAAKKIKTEGKNYFYNLRIETHEDEARKMLERISKAELARSLTNGGTFADAATLIEAGLLPDDMLTSASTGYNYVIKLSDDKTKYSASATPAEYGKSGRLSFLLQPDGNGVSHVASKDNKGQPLKK
jgi:hypothetical protein